MATLPSNLIGPFDVSAHISPPGERDEEGTSVTGRDCQGSSLHSRVIRSAGVVLLYGIGALAAT
jgi:hypothetical protein